MTNTHNMCECGKPKDTRAKKCAACSGRSYPVDTTKIIASLPPSALMSMKTVQTVSAFQEAFKNQAIKNASIVSQIQMAIPNVKSFSALAATIGVSRQFATKIAKQSEIDISHFSRGRNRPYTPDILLVKGTKRQNGTVKKLLLDNGLLDNVCSSCGQGPEWNGSPLVLELEHIDGDPTNNLLHNLTILCPNCHSQTPTNKGKNSKGTKKGR